MLTEMEEVDKKLKAKWENRPRAQKYVLALVKENEQITAKIFDSVFDCTKSHSLAIILRTSATFFDYKLVQDTLDAIK